jgi:hypothetical protein
MRGEGREEGRGRQQMAGGATARAAGVIEGWGRGGGGGGREEGRGRQQMAGGATRAAGMM